MMARAVAALVAFLALVLGSPAHSQPVPRLDLGDVEAKLRLDPAQKAQFDAAMDATRRAMLATGLVALELKARLAQELAKDRPELERLLADPDALIDPVRPQWREAHEEWRRFYGMLDERQVAIARDAIERRLAILEDMGAAFLKGFRDRVRP